LRQSPNRQAQIYERQGLRLDRSTFADWIGRAAFHLRPVHECIPAHLKSLTKLFANETTAPALDARDDRPLGGSDPPAVAYVNAPDRKASNRGLPSRLAQQASKRGRLRGESGKVTVALSFDHLLRSIISAPGSGRRSKAFPHRRPSRAHPRECPYRKRRVDGLKQVVPRVIEFLTMTGFKPRQFLRLQEPTTRRRRRRAL
jgi:transposase